MKIAFINLSLRPDAKTRMLPVGLAYILTATKKAGFDFDLIDMDIDNMPMTKLKEILGRTTYDVYAFGCIVTGFRYVVDATKIIRETNPQAIIIAGNSVATSVPELLLNKTGVDIAVIGEGDITIVELLQKIDRKDAIDGVNGIAYKNEGKVIFTHPRTVVKDVDNLGFPEWELFDLQKYEEYAKKNISGSTSDASLSYPLNAARGCPFDCTFCYHCFKGENYRKYSEDAVFKEINRLHSSYGCDYILFWDELTFPNTKSVERMIGKFSKLNFKIGWQASARAGLFTRKDIPLIREMKDSGCEFIGYSLENANPEILDAMNKKITVDQFIDQAHALWKGGVTPLTSVIFGYPQETPESIKQTLAVCEECNIYPSVGFLLPLPGTPIYNWALQHGKISNELKYLLRIGDRQDFHVNLTTMSDQEFVDTVSTELNKLAERQEIQSDSIFKTVTYQVPKGKIAAKTDNALAA